MKLSRRSRLAGTAIAGAMLLTMLGAGPAGAAATPAVPEAQTIKLVRDANGQFVPEGDVHAAWWKTWDRDKAYGAGYLYVDDWGADGWVEDQKADGYCVQVQILWGAGVQRDYDYSSWACPSGESKDITKRAGDEGSYFQADWAEVSLCRVKTGSPDICEG